MSDTPAGWVTDHPPTTADLDTCVTCGLCLPVCPTFRLTGDETASPRGRLAAVGAVDAHLAVVDARFDEVTSFCLQCRACETACPSMVPYGEIIEAARAEAVEQTGGPASRVERWILGRGLGLPWLLRLVTILAAVLQRLGLLGRLPIVGGQTAGLRRIPLPVQTSLGGAWGDPGSPRVAFFTGCVADVWFPETHRAAIEVLVRAGYRVEAVDGQTCCGALAAHSGHGEAARRLAQRNLDVLAGYDTIVVDVAGCGAHVKGYGRIGGSGAEVARRVRDITEVVAEAIDDGRLPNLAGTGVRVAVQDPCHLEHGQGVVDAPRRIVAAAGYEVVDADPGGLCCGAAGLYQLHHPEAGTQLGRDKAAAVTATGARIVASANAGCEMQLRRFLPSGYDIVHPIELYAGAIRRRS